MAVRSLSYLREMRQPPKFGGVMRLNWVSAHVVIRAAAGKGWVEMKTMIRTLSAVIAGVLLNIGLSRTAEWFDPISTFHGPVMSSEMEMATTCAMSVVPDKSEFLC